MQSCIKRLRKIMKKIAYLLGFVAVVSALHAVAAIGLAEHPSILVAYSASISIITAYCASILFSLYGVKRQEYRPSLEHVRRRLRGVR
jgi:hypothetical protein